MKSTILAAALAAIFAAPLSMAAESEAISVQDLSELTGMSVPELRLVFGARSSPGRYPMNYESALREWVRAAQRLEAEGVIVFVRDGKPRVMYAANAGAR